MKTVKFKHGMAPYQAGEAASFEDDYAEKIVAMGYGEYVKAVASVKEIDEAPVDKMVKRSKTKSRAN